MKSTMLRVVLAVGLAGEDVHGVHRAVGEPDRVGLSVVGDH